VDRYYRIAWIVMAAIAFGSGPVSAVDDTPAEESVRATVKITRGPTSGTGFFVDATDPDEPKTRRTVLVSAAHVFDDMKGTDCTVVFRAPGPGGTFVRREVTVSLRNGDKPRWVRHPDVDVAALSIEIPDGVDVKPFAYRQLADAKWAADRKVRVGQEVCIPCYPVGIEANPAGWPVLRQGMIATHPLTPLAAAKTMFVDYTHFRGDSGAPVVSCSGAKPVVVGVVIAMQQITAKTVTPFEERTVHTSLGLAIAVQSPFIRDTVDLVFKK
jgi:hypothetical protein